MDDGRESNVDVMPYEDAGIDAHELEDWCPNKNIPLMHDHRARIPSIPVYIIYIYIYNYRVVLWNSNYTRHQEATARPPAAAEAGFELELEVVANDGVDLQPCRP